jgi:hypothetical protein
VVYPPSTPTVKQPPIRVHGQPLDEKNHEQAREKRELSLPEPDVPLADSHGRPSDQRRKDRHSCDPSWGHAHRFEAEVRRQRQHGRCIWGRDTVRILAFDLRERGNSWSRSRLASFLRGVKLFSVWRFCMAPLETAGCLAAVALNVEFVRVQEVVFKLALPSEV